MWMMFNINKCFAMHDPWSLWKVDMNMYSVLMDFYFNYTTMH